MSSADLVRAFQTDLAIISVILLILCGRAIVAGYRQNESVPLLLSGIFLQWIPLAIGYVWLMWAYWVNDLGEPFAPPNWARISVQLGLILGGSLIFMAIQPPPMKRLAALVWFPMHLLLILVLVLVG
jgi:hypothetical protein